jgi:hypothetical protein
MPVVSRPATGTVSVPEGEADRDSRVLASGGAGCYLLGCGGRSSRRVAYRHMSRRRPPISWCWRNTPSHR